MTTQNLTITPVAPEQTNEWPRIYTKRNAPYIMYLVFRDTENRFGDTYLSMMCLHGATFWTEIRMPESKIDEEYERLPSDNIVTLAFRT
jgi:hypothetical protein